MNKLLTQENLASLNSLTKYPSIQTYHTLGEKGRLTESLNVEFTGDVFASEKIDGTNSRLIWTKEGVIVGSREDFLWATGDLIHNPAMGIVSTLRMLAETLRERQFIDEIVVFYGEVYGHNVGAAAKQYTTTSKTAFRLFDVCKFGRAELPELLRLPLERASAWRENGGQSFLEVDALSAIASDVGVERAPNCGVFEGEGLPHDKAGLFAFLTQFERSNACLEDSGKGEAEGIVIRSKDRKRIAKLRFEDYRRSLGR
jgi:hypothetical protein